MYTLYSFMVIPNFNDNTPGQGASVGEMSKYSSTFSNEIGLYRQDAYKNVSMLSFDSRRDDVKVTVGIAYFDPLLQISQWLYDRSITSNLPNSPALLKQALQAEFGDVCDITDVGQITTFKTYLFPERVTISFTNTGEENECYLWYSESNFQQYYPKYEIIVVPPVPNIDDLMANREAVIAQLGQVTTVSHNRDINDAAQGKPQTDLDTHSYSWTDPDNSTITAPALFTALIYGPQGINIDLIEEAFRNWILANSKYGVDDWRVRLPELFLPTEFYLVPLWDRYSLPNQTQEKGKYCPSIQPNDIPKYANKYFKGYSADYIGKNTNVSGSAFESALFISIGNEQNYKAEQQFVVQWPDYMVASVNSVDYAKMSPATQAFVMAMFKLFAAAEDATETSLIPTGMTRTERDGVYYLTTTVSNVQYLCPIKKGFAIGE